MHNTYALFDNHGNAFGWYDTSDEALRDVRLLLDAEDRESAQELRLIHFDAERHMVPAMDGDALIRAAEALPKSAVS
jgi:hypothetical protein